MSRLLLRIRRLLNLTQVKRTPIIILVVPLESLTHNAKSSDDVQLVSKLMVASIGSAFAVGWGSAASVFIVSFMVKCILVLAKDQLTNRRKKKLPGNEDYEEFLTGLSAKWWRLTRSRRQQKKSPGYSAEGPYKS